MRAGARLKSTKHREGNHRRQHRVTSLTKSSISAQKRPPCIDARRAAESDSLQALAGIHSLQETG